MTTANGGGSPNYYPNSFNGPVPSAAGRLHSDSVTGDVVRAETGNEDNFSQCGDFFRQVLDKAGRERLTDNIAGHIAAAPPFVRERAIANFSAADVTYGRMIREKVGVILRKPKPFPAPKKVASLSPPRVVPTVSECPYGFSSKL